MVKRTLILTLAAIAALAAVPVRTMYNDAFAREKEVRAELDIEDPAPAVLTHVRAVVARYEAVVRRYPASSYSDNALWQAAQLSFDAFKRFSQPQDRDAGVRLLRRLAAMFPTSKLAKQVPGQLARYAAADAAPPTRSSATAAAPAPEAPAAAAAPAAPRSADAPAVAAAPSWGGATPRTENTSIATITGIRRSVLADAVRVVIELDNEVAFRQDRIPDPSRVFVDLPGTRATTTLIDRTLRFDGDADVVRQIRLGRHPNNTTRIVLDANGVSSYSVYPLYEPYRLVIDCVRETPITVARSTTGTPAQPPQASRPPAAASPSVSTTAAAPEATAKPPAPRREPPPLSARPAAAGWLRSAPSNVSQHGVLLAEAHAALVDGPPTLSVVAPPLRKPAEIPAAPPSRNSNGNFSIARQLGLGVSRIVIDAGHGGHDPGAQARGVVEAELVLDVALRLEKLLQKLPGVEVVLTRRSDEFIALQERTAIANREGADLFLSIHANASQSAQARGIETYFLNFASNLSAAAVAARENAASGQTMGALPDIVKAIALNNKLDESRDFATQVQRAMLDHLRSSNKAVRDLGVKQAPFVVLIGAAMPSVLAEISFVTNPQEARLLKSGGYRQRIADALFAGIRNYQALLNKTTTVASQQ
jgi:N-acetylmuramoyl-L-alanine amidase